MARELSRRVFLQSVAMAAVGAAAVSCAQPTPQVIEKEVPIERVVKETVVVEKEVPIERVVTPTPVVMKHREAPQLAGLVAQGRLPSVDERLPDEPLVITPVEEIGQYGGTWHRLATSAGDTQMHAKMTYEWMFRYDTDGAGIVPNVAKSWEVSPDGKVFTFNLRKGMKWSDGAPYTADDMMFKYEDEWLNEELANMPAEYRPGGESMVVEKVDDTTVRFVFAVPYGLFMRVVAGMRGSHLTDGCKHYMSQFHPKYADKEVLDKAVKDAGFEHWYQLYGNLNNVRNNVDRPVLYAWQLTVAPPKIPIVVERNPYYWKVDPEGNQLPYIDRIEFMLVESAEQINIRAAQGEVGMQLRHITFDNYPIFQENREKGDYRTLLWNTGNYNIVIGVHQEIKDPVLQEIVQDKRLRYALSLGMKRAEIIEAVFLGITEPNQVSPMPTSPHYWQEQAKNMIEHDLARANAYLDEMGLTQRDSEGYRLRPDGRRLGLIYGYAPVFGAWGITGELLRAHWKELGIDLIVTEVARQLFGEQALAGEIHLAIWTGSGEFDPLIEPRSFVPINTHPYHFAPYADWWRSGGTEGVEPTGDVRKLLEIWEEVRLAVDEEEQVRLFRQILELHKENLWLIGISTPPPTLVIVKNNFRNVPEVALYDDQTRSPGNTATEQYFIKQG